MSFLASLSMTSSSVSRPHSRIRQARSKARLSQTKLAQALGLHRSAVSNWESLSGSLPTVENLLRIAQLTNVNFEWLALGRGKMPHLNDEHEPPAVHPDCYAHDWNEERLLRDFRSLPASSQRALVDFLDGIRRRR